MENPTEDSIPAKLAAVNSEINTLCSEKVRVSELMGALLEKKESLERERNRKIAQDYISWDSWITVDPGWRGEIQEILERKCHLTEFRPFQLAAINATLTKRNVFLISPTATGKSLCYLVPAFKETGITLVICSSLSSLEDQLYKARQLKLSADKVTPEDGRCLRDAVCKQLSNDDSVFKLLFITADILVKNQKLMSHLKTAYAQNNITRIVIDEFHCCSECGHDYHTEYRLLPVARHFFPNVPIFALTATATVPVIGDALDQLEIETSVVIKVPFEKQNVFYRVVQKPYLFDKSMEMIRTFITRKYRNLPGIIYVDTLDNCETVTKGLRDIGLKAKVYNSETQLDGTDKVYEKWMKNAFQILVTTSEFGSGLDNPEVRYVIHFSTPRSVEEIYQQGGRGARDGRPAICVTFFKLLDYFRHHTSFNTERHNKRNTELLDYLLNYRECRHVLLARQLEDFTSSCKDNCDNCTRTDTVEKSVLSRPCIELYHIIRDAAHKKRSLPLKTLVSVWFRVAALEISKEDAEILITHLIHVGALTVEKGKSGIRVKYFVRCCYEAPPETGLEVYLKQNDTLRRYLSDAPVICEISRLCQQMSMEPRPKRKKKRFDQSPPEDEIIELSD